MSKLQVTFPPCDRCKGRGFYVDEATQWPTECKRCADARKAAVTKAQADARKRKAGKA